MNIKEVIKKQGGLKLVKQFWKSGALFTAAGEFVLLGKSRTALEILRLSTQLKVKQKLQKKYISALQAFDGSYDTSLPHAQSNKVWICWFQGMEYAPQLVQKCYQSVKEHMPDKEIILITSDNISNYVDFPDFILDKWKKGMITHTHMTDLLRIELLIRYGGLWLDSTVLCTSGEIPAYFFDSDLFFYQCLKPGRDGHASYISSWLMSAKTNNKILMAVRYLCYEYWKTHDVMIDYFLLHDFAAIVLDFYPEEWKQIIPRDNATPHLLLLRLFDQFDMRMWQAITTQTPFHKLSYKFTKDQVNRSGTYYDYIIG